jgi:site-specific recombinase XerD
MPYVDTFLLAQEAAHHTPKTLAYYSYTLRSFASWLEVREVKGIRAVTGSDIRTYLIQLEKRGLKPTSVHDHARGIRAWMNWLVKEGDLSISPMHNVEMPKQEKPLLPALTVEQIKATLVACGKTPIGLRDRAMMMALLDSGLRPCEFTAIKVGDLDMKSGLIKVHGKGHKERKVVLGAKTRLAIVRYMKTRPETKPHDPMWISYDLQGQTSDALTYWGLREVLRKLARRVGIPQNCLKYRHTFATWAVRGQMDVFSLQRLMGHADVTTTRRYLDQNDNDIREAHRRSGPVDNML